MIRISWGVKIAILYTGFVILIATLVINSMRQNFDLVATDYYQQEIQYQKVIDAGKNQATLSSPVQIHANETAVILNFPKEFTGKLVKGKALFYSEINSAWDKSFDISTDANMAAFMRKELKPAAYKLKINWEADGKAYYQESTINLQ
jgi:hypothetical protein